MIEVSILVIWIIVGILSLYKCIKHLEVLWFDYWVLYAALIVSLLGIILEV